MADDNVVDAFINAIVEGLTKSQAFKEWLEKEDGGFIQLEGNDSCEVKVNDLFVMETPGGGGFGSK